MMEEKSTGSNARSAAKGFCPSPADRRWHVTTPFARRDSRSTCWRSTGISTWGFPRPP